MSELPRNPHFDDERVVWDDAYSGEYGPVQYDSQFDSQWELYREQASGFANLAGVETRDPWIDERILELTGEEGFLQKQKYGVVGYRLLDFFRKKKKLGLGTKFRLQPAFAIDHFRGKQCLDVGCGAGRWTRTLKSLGANVKSTDMSQHGLQSTRQFNDDVEELDLFAIPRRSDLQARFDFTICWGVIMHTHDPRAAFDAVAATVAPGGELYTMIYAPEGMHNSPEVREHRRVYHRELSDAEQKFEYAKKIAGKSGNVLGHLDMLNTFYNWVVPESVIHNWYRTHGLDDVVTLNAHEQPKCAYHVVGRKSEAALADAA